MRAFASYLQRLLPRGVGTLAGSSIASQLATLVVIPVLARWCSLSDFGLLQIYASVLSAAGLIACLRYDYALLQPADPTVAAQLGLLSLLVAMGMGLASLAAVPLLAYSFQTHGWHELTRLTPVVAAAIAVTGMGSAATQWLVRTGRFRTVAQARLVQSVVVAALQLAAGASGLGGTGLILGDAIGRLAGLVVLLWGSDLWRHLPGNRTDFRILRQLAGDFRRFPLVATPSALINATGFFLPVFFLERFFGTAGLGIYSLLERVMGVPTMFVGQPLSQTFIHRLREALARGSAAARQEITATARTAALLGLVPFLALLVIGPALFVLVFGEQWRPTGQLAQVLALAYFITYALWPVTPTLTVLNRLRTQMAWDTARVLCLLGLAWLAGSGAFRLETMIIMIVITQTILAVIHFWLCRRATEKTFPGHPAR